MAYTIFPPIPNSLAMLSMVCLVTKRSSPCRSFAVGMEKPFPPRDDENAVIGWWFESFGAYLRESSRNWEKTDEGREESSCINQRIIKAYAGGIGFLKVGRKRPRAMGGLDGIGSNIDSKVPKVYKESPTKRLEMRIGRTRTFSFLTVEILTLPSPIIKNHAIRLLLCCL